MNKNDFIGIVLDELYRIFDILNAEYYSNKLPCPMLTVQKAKRSGNLGWFTLDKVWTNKNSENDSLYEINISAEHLGGSVYDIVDTLQHEMVHYANKMSDVKDCSGQIHNKKFKTLAESVGLVVEKSKKFGYGHTLCSDEFKKFIDDNIKPNSECFVFFRNAPTATPKQTKEKTTFTYICPQCEEKIKAAIDKHIVCGECNCDFKIKE